MAGGVVAAALGDQCERIAIPVEEAIGVEVGRPLPDSWIAVGAVDVEHRPVALLEAVAVPFELAGGAAGDQREEGREAPHLLGEAGDVALTVLAQPLAPTGVLVQGQGREGDVAGDGDGGTEDVQELDRGDLDRKRSPLEVTVRGDRRQGRPLRRAQAAGAGLADGPLRPGLATSPCELPAQLARTDRAGAVE